MSLENLLARALAPPELGQTPCDVVHAENKWRLLRYRGAPKHPLPVLLVPSLINRHYVLDLMPGKSLVEYLLAAGHDVFIIDWGTPGDEDRYLDFDEIVDRYLGRAIRKTLAAAGADRLHLLGYCLGGTFTAIHAAAHPASIASLVALAAPIRFAEGGMLTRWMRLPTLDIRAVVGAFGNMPWPLMQASFHLLKPTLLFQKARTAVDRAWDDEFLDGFFALERWGNDNVSFPGRAYAEYIERLYQRDALVNGTLRLAGRPVRLEAIRCPTLVVTFADDYIVPRASALPLLDLAAAKDKQHLDLRGGHVGAVVSRKARDGLWPALSDFWVQRMKSRRARKRA